MKSSLTALLGVCAALLFSLIVLGGMTLTLAERGAPLISAPGQPPTASEATMLGQIRVIAATSTALATATSTLVAAVSPGLTTPTGLLAQACPPEGDWIEVTVQEDETLADLAGQLGLSPEVLAMLNCLTDDEIVAGDVLFVPVEAELAMQEQTETPAATERVGSRRTAKRTAAKCGPPSGWVRYNVRRGDTLSLLARTMGVSVSQLQLANCLGSSTLIRAGQLLYVPYIPYHAPTATPVRRTPTAQPTKTHKPSPTVLPTRPPAPTDPPPTQPPPPTEPPPPTAVPTDPQPPTPTPFTGTGETMIIA